MKNFNGFSDENIIYWLGAMALKEADECNSINDFNNFLINISIDWVLI